MQLRYASLPNAGSRVKARQSVVLAKVLFEHGPLCGACISVKSALAIGHIEPTISRFQQTLAMKRDMGICRPCGRWRLVYSLFDKRQSSRLRQLLQRHVNFWSIQRRSQVAALISACCEVSL
jgi:hypothetical protein